MFRWCNLIFFILAIHGCMVDGFLRSCNITSRCQDLELKEELDRIGWMPTTEAQLIRLCPSAVPAVRCAVEKIQECVGKDLYEVSTSNNQTAAAFAHAIITIRDLIFEICDPGSELRQNYLSSITCVKNLGTDPKVTMKCQQKGYAAYTTYQRAKSLLSNEVTAEDNVDNAREPMCMMQAYALACFAEEVDNTCGVVARNTFVDTLKRFQYLKREACSDANINSLKTEFLNHLELEGQRRSIFSSVFDSKKRRK